MTVSALRLNMERVYLSVSVVNGIVAVKLAEKALSQLFPLSPSPDES